MIYCTEANLIGTYGSFLTLIFDPSISELIEFFLGGGAEKNSNKILYFIKEPNDFIRKPNVTDTIASHSNCDPQF